jgi:hypothetical protein
LWRVSFFNFDCFVFGNLFDFNNYLMVLFLFKYIALPQDRQLLYIVIYSDIAQVPNKAFVRARVAELDAHRVLTRSVQVQIPEAAKGS